MRHVAPLTVGQKSYKLCRISWYLQAIGGMLSRSITFDLMRLYSERYWHFSISPPCFDKIHSTTTKTRRHPILVLATWLDLDLKSLRGTGASGLLETDAIFQNQVRVDESEDTVFVKPITINL